MDHPNDTTSSTRSAPLPFAAVARSLRRHGRSIVGAALGVPLGLLTVRTSWGDMPAPLEWSALGAVVVVAAIVARAHVPWPLALKFLVVAGSMAFSVAHGASLAAATWWPVALALVFVGTLFPTALLGFTLALLLRDAGTLVLLSFLQDVAVYSGSTQYFMGFVGAVAAPLWFALGLRPAGSALARAVAGFALVVSALAVWVVLVSSSRTALLALVIASVFGVAVVLVRRLSKRSSVWPLLARVGAVAVLVGIVDLGLGVWFGDGSSTIARVLAPRMEATVAEVDRDRIERGPLGMRFALWRQALTMVANRPLGHGPGSYGSINHAYQGEAMLWSGSPHSVWATAAIESGVLGLVALGLLVALGFVRAARQWRPEALVLLAAAVVMSLDIFDHMPFQASLWWLAIGAAWHAPGARPRPSKGDALASIAVVAVVALALVSTVRMAAPCGEGCDPVERYAGHLRLLGAVGVDISEDAPAAYDETRFKRMYPLSYRHRYLVAARATRDDDELMALQLVDFPWHRAPAYVHAAERAGDLERTANVAACGLELFYGEQMVWRTSARITSLEFAAVRERLTELSAGVEPSSDACARAGISLVPLALR